MTKPASTADLLPYLSRPMTPPREEVQIAIERGPIAIADALPRTQVDRLLDPAPLPAETGWCTLDDDTGYVAVRTPMPGVTSDMIEWWYGWRNVLRLLRPTRRRGDMRAHSSISHRASANAWGSTSKPCRS